MRFLPILFIALSLGLYAGALSHNFVWDDHYFIDENSKLDDPDFIRSAFTKDLWQNTDAGIKSGFYRPLTLSATYLVSRAAGTSAWAYHLISILLHGLNGALLFLFLDRLTGRRLAAFFAAVLFIVHPLSSETVNLIANWGDLFCAFFMFLCLFHYLAFLERRAGRDLLFSLILLFLAFLSKENAMAGIGLIVLTHYFFASRTQSRHSTKDALFFLPFLVLTLLYIGLRTLIVGPLNALTTLENVRYVSVLPSYDTLSHLLTTSKIVTLYLQMFFYPTMQSISHIMLPSAEIFEFETFFAALAVTALLALALVSFFSDRKWIGFGLGWFFVMILPVSNLIPISNTIAERFMYLPMVGLCYLTAEMFAQVMVSIQMGKRRICLVLFALLVAGLALKTYRHNNVWATDYTLFSQTKDTIGCAPIAHINLVAYYNREQQWEKAAQEQFLFDECKAAIREEYDRLKGLRQK